MVKKQPGRPKLNRRREPDEVPLEKGDTRCNASVVMSSIIIRELAQLIPTMPIRRQDTSRLNKD